MADERIDLQRQFSLETVRMLRFFVTNTIDGIFRHIERLKIKDTGALKDSIKATIHTNAGGNEALVRFFYLDYGDCVEQAVGKYYGVDVDLGEGTGVKSRNIQAPEITGVGYGAMTPSFSGISETIQAKGKHEGEFRGKYHRPRPFLRSEIRHQVDYISQKLMREAGMLIDIRVAGLIGDTVGEEIRDLLMAPFAGRKEHEYQFDDTIADAKATEAK